MIDFASNKLKQMQEGNIEPEIPTSFTGFPRNASRYTVEWSNNIEFSTGPSPRTGWVASSDTKIPKNLNLFTMVHLHYEYFLAKDPWVIETEYVRDGVIFRGHPNYRSNGEWKDWVMIQFERTPTDNKQNKTVAKQNWIAFGMEEEDYDGYYYVPAEIQGFFQKRW
jgi:hypothetical protein